MNERVAILRAAVGVALLCVVCGTGGILMAAGASPDLARIGTLGFLAAVAVFLVSFTIALVAAVASLLR